MPAGRNPRFPFAGSKQRAELHTDAAEQAYTLQTLSRRLAVSGIVTTLMILSALVMMSFALFLDGTPLLALIEGPMQQMPVLVLLYAYVACSMLRAVASMKGLVRSMRDGKVIDHRADWRKHRRGHRAAMVMLGILAPICIAMPFISLVAGNSETLPMTGDGAVYLRLAAIESDEALVREHKLTIEGVDWGNHVTYDWTLLAPAIYTVDENGIIPGRTWRDGDGAYTPSLHCKVYNLRFSWLAEGLLDSLRTRLVSAIEPPMTEIQHPGFDRLFAACEGTHYELLASRGNIVVRVRYFGERDTERIIDAILRMLDSAQDSGRNEQ